MFPISQGAGLERIVKPAERLIRTVRITQRAFTKFRYSMQRRGISGTLKLCIDVPRLLHTYGPGAHGLADEVVEFDREYQTDTSGSIDLVHLRIRSRNFAFGAGYEGSNPALVRRMMQLVPAELEKFTLVDFGSGKGRVLLIASEFHFQRIVGVEFSAELCEIASHNRRVFASPEQKCANIEIVCSDVEDYAIPDLPLVVYFFNPFGPEVMKKVLYNITSSLQQMPRPCFVLYHNPVCGSLWETSPMFRKLHGETQFSIFTFAP
jgi:hypothetical protein